MGEGEDRLPPSLASCASMHVKGSAKCPLESQACCFSYRWLQVPYGTDTSFPPLLTVSCNKLAQPCTRCVWAAAFGPRDCPMQGRRLDFAGAAGAIGPATRARRTMSHTFWGPAHAGAQLAPCAHEIVKCNAVERTNMRPACGSVMWPQASQTLGNRPIRPPAGLDKVY